MYGIIMRRLKKILIASIVMVLGMNFIRCIAVALNVMAMDTYNAFVPVARRREIEDRYSAVWFTKLLYDIQGGTHRPKGNVPYISQAVSVGRPGANERILWLIDALCIKQNLTLLRNIWIHAASPTEKEKAAIKYCKFLPVKMVGSVFLRDIICRNITRFKTN